MASLFYEISGTVAASQNPYFIHTSAVGDFNGDGIQDFIGCPVAFGQPIANAIKLLVGDGHGNYREAAAEVISGGVPSLYQGREIVVADFNGDSRADVFIAAHGLDTASLDMPGEHNVLLLSNAQGGLTNSSASLPNYSDFSHSAAAGDADGDGDIDIYVGNFRGIGTYKLPYFLLNDGAGNFLASTALVPADELSESASAKGSSALVDVNGDGELDLVLGDHGGRHSRIYLNEGGAYSTSAIPLPPVVLHGSNAVVLDIVSDDFDNDGRTDLVFTGQGFPNHFSDLNGYTGHYIQFLRNTVNGFVDETAVRFPGGIVDDDRLQNTFFMGTLDLNEDGHTDIVVRTASSAGQDETPGTPYFWLNDGAGFFAPVSFSLLSSSFSSKAKVIEPIDADGVNGIDFIGADFNWTVYRSAVPLSTGPDYIDPASSGAPGFNESYYLRVHTSAAQAVASGAYESGLSHYLGIGRAQGLSSFAPGTHLRGTSAIDSATYAGKMGDYMVTAGTSATVLLRGAQDQPDVLLDVERLHFNDGKLALDVNGNAGVAYRLYQAAFDRTPDVEGLGYQMHDLDIGVGVQQVAANFIASPEFQSTYGNVQDAQFVTLLYRNVLDREPEAAGLQYHVSRLSTGATRADILIGFSESPENQANVIGVIEHGMFYV